VSTLLELQRAMRASMLDRNDGEIAAMLAEHTGPDRLNIYRNTFVVGVTKALGLAYPAVRRLVGGEFFDGAAGLFIADHPPRAAWLDTYGAEFPEFLRIFQPAATLAYLPDVARLEWAVSRAIHAADEEPLDLKRLEALAPDEQARVCFVPHPSVALLRTDYPADAIWRGVLNGDDAALAAVDVDSGPAHLLVERRVSGVEVSRLDEAAWRLTAALCDGRPLEMALAQAGEAQTYVLLAEQLTAGRFVDFSVSPADEAGTGAAPTNERQGDEMTAIQSARGGL
jgi:hypothetical protein